MDDLTPPRVPQQARSRAKHERLLAAALDLFSERGYEGATVDAIAERAGVSVGIFYSYFRSKRQVLLTLVRERMEQSLTELEMVDIAQMSVDRLETRIQVYLQRAVEHNGLRRARLELILSDAEFAAIARAEALTLQQEIAQIIERWQSQGGLRSDVSSQGAARLMLHLLFALRDEVTESTEDIRRDIVRTAAQMIYHLFVPDVGS